MEAFECVKPICLSTEVTMVWYECRLAMSCNLAQQQRVVAMVQIEGMVEVEEEVVAVVAMAERVHGIDHTEDVMAQCVYGLESHMRSVSLNQIWL